MAKVIYFPKGCISIKFTFSQVAKAKLGIAAGQFWLLEISLRILGITLDITNCRRSTISYIE